MFQPLEIKPTLSNCYVVPPGGGGGDGGTHYDDLYGEALPERGTFFKLQVYERGGISLGDVYKRVGKSVIWICKRVQKKRANR